MNTVDGVIDDTRASIEVLSSKIGVVLLVLGGMHFFNLYVFSRIRRRTTLRHSPPPVLPDDTTLVQVG